MAGETRESSEALLQFVAVLAAAAALCLPATASARAERESEVSPATVTPEAAVDAESTGGDGALVGKYVGISEYFLRWPQAEVRWVYDPSNAPPSFRTRDKEAVELIKRSMGQWERVSGLRFEFEGIERGPVGDPTVRVYWASLGDGPTLAQAGPSYFVRPDIALGYRPIVGGEVELNRDSETMRNYSGSQLEQMVFMGTVTHEIGHLIGLGHSDDPASIMADRPYGQRVTLADDDVRAVQELYGHGSRMPPFGKTKWWDFDVRDEGVEAYIANDQKEPFVKVREGMQGMAWAAVEMPATPVRTLEAVVLDQDDNLLRVSRFPLAPRDRLSKGYVKFWAISEMDVLMAMPGRKRVLMGWDGRFVAERYLEIDTNAPVNAMPEIEIEISPWRPKAGEKVTLRADYGKDPERDRVTATWHVPQNGEFESRLERSGGRLEQEVIFRAAGEYEVFLSLTDDINRYGGESGPGFRKAVRTVVKVR